MHCLSVKQPWATMIASGEKTIETRTWGTAYRGPLLIVSSKKPDIAPTGCAVAIVDLVDCRRMTMVDEIAACCYIYPRAVSWVLKNIRAVKPFPVQGERGIYVRDIRMEDLEFLP